jgi:hypothetical protein
MEIFGIYNSDGGIVGEIKYAIGKISNSNHCELCDITHSLIYKKRIWKKFINDFSFSFRLLHLNEQSNHMAKFTDAKTPCVLIENNNEYTMLLNSEELKNCEGNVSKFVEIFKSKLNSI